MSVVRIDRPEEPMIVFHTSSVVAAFALNLSKQSMAVVGIAGLLFGYYVWEKFGANTETNGEGE